MTNDSLFGNKVFSKETFGRYMLQKLISGSMGSVYLAYDPQKDKHVALKLIQIEEDRSFIDDCIAQIESISELKHPNIVTVHDTGHEKGSFFFIMDEDYIKNTYLNEIDAQLSLKKRMEIALKIVHTIQFLHEKNIIHGDLQPINIMLTARNKPRIMNPGLVKLLPATELILDSLQYTSPEQTEQSSSPTKKDDLYALGGILYFLVTGQHPFAAETRMQVLTKVLQENPTPPQEINPDIPEKISNLCCMMLEKKQENRYQTIEEICGVLEQVVGKPFFKTKSTNKNKQKLHRNTSWILPVITSVLIAISTAFATRMYYKQQMNQQVMKMKKVAEAQRKTALTKVSKAQQILKKYREELLKTQNEYKNRTQQLTESIYRSKIYLADLLNTNNRVKEADKVINSIAKLGMNHQENWEYRWQKSRKHLEVSHPISARKWKILDMDIAQTGDIVAIANNKIVYRAYNKNFQEFTTQDWPWQKCVISPNGKYLAAGDLKGNVHIWDTDKQQKIITKSFAVKGKTYEQKIHDLHFDKTSQKLLIAKGIEDRNNRDQGLILFDVSKQIVTTLSLPKKYQKPFYNDFLSCHMSNNGKFIVATNEDGSIYMWNISSGAVRAFPLTKNKTRKHSCRIHKSNIIVLAGNLFVLNIKNKKIQEIDIGKRMTSFDIHANRIVAGCEDGTLHLWKIGKKIQYQGFLTGQSNSKKCKFSSDGKKIFSGGNDGIKVWNSKMTKKSFAVPISDSSRFCIIHPRQNIAVVAPLKEGGISLYNTQTGNKIQSRDGRDKLIGNFSGISDGFFIGEKLYVIGYDGVIVKWDLENFTKEKTFHTFQKAKAFPFKDGKCIAIISRNGYKIYIKMIDLQSEEEVSYTYPVKSKLNNYLSTLRVSCDGKETLVFVQQQNLVFFNLKTNKITRNVTLEFEPSNIFVTFNEKQHFIFAVIDNEICQYRINEDELILINRFHSDSHINKIKIFEKQLVGLSQNGFVHLWPLRSSQKSVKPYFTIKGKAKYTAFAFSHNRFVACSTSSDEYGSDNFLEIHNTSLDE